MWVSESEAVEYYLQGQSAPTKESDHMAPSLFAHTLGLAHCIHHAQRPCEHIAQSERN